MSRNDKLAPNDPGPIPKGLLVSERKPLTPEQQAKADEAKKKAATDRAFDPRKWDRPRGMSDEDYEAMKSRERQKMDQKKSAPRERKPEKVKKEQPKGTFRLIDWAKQNDLVPRDVRMAARANKDKLSALESGGKYIYPDKSEGQVATIVKGWLDNKKKSKPEKTKKAPATKKATPPIPPPSETVWSGKAKKRKKSSPPKPINKKAEMRKEIKAATRKKK